jgi:hypothetical protein
MFILLTAYVVVMLFGAFRLPRAVFHPMLLLWHLTVTGIVVAGVVAEGAGATWEGQGLRFSFALWAVGLVCVAFTALAAMWIVVDRRAGGAPTSVPWAPANTALAASSLLLLAVAVALFRAGTNYNWVTAVAIVTTVFHWILLVQSFAPPTRSSTPP